MWVTVPKLQRRVGSGVGQHLQEAGRLRPTVVNYRFSSEKRKPMVALRPGVPNPQISWY